MSRVLVDDITGPAGPAGPAGPPGADGGLSITDMRNIDCVIRYSGTQPERSTGTTDTLRRVRWVSDVEPQLGGAFALDGDVWENTSPAVPPPPTGDIVRTTPAAGTEAFWTGTPLLISSITIPAGAVLVVNSSDTSDNGGSSATSLPILTNSGAPRTWSRLTTGMSSPGVAARMFIDYWYNDTGSPVTFDLTVTWGPDTPSSNFDCAVSLQLLEGVEDPAVTAPVHAMVNSGSTLSVSIASDVGFQTLMAFVMGGSGAVAIGTDYLSGTSSDSSPASTALVAGEISYGWLFRTAQETDNSSHIIGVNTPHPVVSLVCIAVAFAPAV